MSQYTVPIKPITDFTHATIDPSVYHAGATVYAVVRRFADGDIGYILTADKGQADDELVRQRALASAGVWDVVVYCDTSGGDG